MISKRPSPKRSRKLRIARQWYLAKILAFIKFRELPWRLFDWPGRFWWSFFFFCVTGFWWIYIKTRFFWVTKSSRNREREIPDTEKVWCVFFFVPRSPQNSFLTRRFFSPQLAWFFNRIWCVWPWCLKVGWWSCGVSCFYDVFWMFVRVKKGAASLCIVYPLLLGLFNSRRLLHCLTDSVGEFVMIFAMILARNVPMHNFGIMYLHIYTYMI